MHNNRYTIVFTLLMCGIISFLLAGTSIVLQERRLLNYKIDMQKNVLVSSGFNVNGNDDVQRLYEKIVVPMLISEDGTVLEIAEENPELDALKIYEIKDENNLNKTNAYVYPVLGQGLWSKLFGFLAVDPEGKKIIGITFYKHGETPGLGAEIEKEWFGKNFVGKELYSEDKFVGITVAKGKAKDDIAYKSGPQHVVDGISGATITSKGVEKMIHTEPLKYQNFFNRVRQS